MDKNINLLLNNFRFELDSRLIEQIDNISDVGLFHGKMGLSIYFFKMSRSFNDSRYQRIAEKLLDDVYQSLNQNGLNTQSALFEFGIPGIGYGLNYLVKGGYAEGNINKILKNIDDFIFRNYSNIVESANEYTINNLSIYGSFDNTMYILLYLYERLKNKSLSINDKIILSKLVIKIINSQNSYLSPEFYEETPDRIFTSYKPPLYLYCLSKIYSLGIYTYKIELIIREITPFVTSRIPLLGLNRLYLLWAMNHMLQVYDNGLWQEHISILSNNINTDFIVSGLRSNQVFVNGGVALVLLLLSEMTKLTTKNYLEINKSNYLEIASNSQMWDTLLTNKTELLKHSGLFDGYTGFFLTVDR